MTITGTTKEGDWEYRGTTEEADYPKKQQLFADSWPQEMSLMACRKWANLSVNNELYEVTSTFMNNKSCPVEPDTVQTFLALYNEPKFTDWLAAVCSGLLNDSLDKEWFENQDIYTKLRDRFECQIQAVMTFPPDGLGFITTGVPLYGKNVHVVFILGKI